MKYSIAVTSHSGKARNNNQDNYYCERNIRELENDSKSFETIVEKDSPWTIAVFDGMGGEKNGEIASLIAAEITADYCKKAGRDCNIEDLITNINARVCEEIDSRKSRMGSTCVRNTPSS